MPCIIVLTAAILNSEVAFCVSEIEWHPCIPPSIPNAEDDEKEDRDRSEPSPQPSSSNAEDDNSTPEGDKAGNELSFNFMVDLSFSNAKKRREGDEDFSFCPSGPSSEVLGTSEAPETSEAPGTNEAPGTSGAPEEINKE